MLTPVSFGRTIYSTPTYIDAMTYFFSKYPEFIEADNRSRRTASPVTIETMSNRMRTIAPSRLIKNKTVLDLGSCLGAAGHWCLSQGASHYTGVEVQTVYTTKSQELLHRYWNADRFDIFESDLQHWLSIMIQHNKKFDVVLLLGVIYSFVDTHKVVSMVSQVCSGTIVVDSLYPPILLNGGYPMIHVNRTQNINASTTDGAYRGVGAVPSPAALNILMSTVGFANNDGLLFPDPAPAGLHDAYLDPVTHENVDYTQTINKFPTRYIQRYVNTGVKSKLLTDVVTNQDDTQLGAFASDPTANTRDGGWKFDTTVAQRFQQEAEQHIPDYQRVIELCVDIVNHAFPGTDATILDVGSALGHTMQTFIRNGYINVFGVDNSQAMIDNSFSPESVTLSDELPGGPWDVILINWTLHFIQQRYQYLTSVYNELAPGGLLVVTDKMDMSLLCKDLYHDMKRANGVSDEVIVEKQKAIAGVLNTRPITWYLDSLGDIGFTQITVMNARLGFVTIMARKPL